MSEVVGDFMAKKLGLTFFLGETPIYGIWATKDLVVTHACVMPVDYGVGDHHEEESMAGIAPFRIKWYTSCRLYTKVSHGATKKYLDRLE